MFRQSTPASSPTQLNDDSISMPPANFRRIPAPPSSPDSNYAGSPPSDYSTLRQYLSLNHQLATTSLGNTISRNINLPDGLDYRGLTYIGDVDENLMCSICHSPFIDPVDTECSHTFCRECIDHALSVRESCPIDRFPLSRQGELIESHKIVLNQLDALLVKCICCDAPIPRAMLQSHVERYCPAALVECPSKLCAELVKRHLLDRGCLHYDVTCPDCQEVHKEVDIGAHRENLCKKREMNCKHCGENILRCKEVEHIKQCPDVVTACQWAEYGCKHESKRKNLPAHADECSLKSMGLVLEKLRVDITALQAGVGQLSQKNEVQARRIMFLEGGLRDWNRPGDYPDISNQSVSNLPEAANSGLLDPTNEYLLSLLEAQDSRIRQVSTGMNELEAKQTVMLFNETMSIKNELAEMRSTQGIISMHVRWLLNFRKQENQRRVGGGLGSNGGSDGGGSSSDMPRRLSDSTPRDIMTRL